MKISFKANVLVNKNMKDYLISEDQKTLDTCIAILEKGKFSKVTEGDTIEIKKGRNSKRDNAKSVNFVINNKNFEKPMEIEFYGFESGKLSLFSLISQMAIYIYCCKFNLNPKMPWGLDDIIKATVEELKKRNLY